MNTYAKLLLGVAANDDIIKVTPSSDKMTIAGGMNGPVINELGLFEEYLNMKVSARLSAVKNGDSDVLYSKHTLFLQLPSNAYRINLNYMIESEEPLTAYARTRTSALTSPSVPSVPRPSAPVPVPLTPRPSASASTSPASAPPPALTQYQQIRAEWNADPANKEEFSGKIIKGGSIAALGTVIDDKYQINNLTHVHIHIVHANADGADITLFNGGAIVNASNETCLGGGGVDFAIHMATGNTHPNTANFSISSTDNGLLKEDCENLDRNAENKRCLTGFAQITPIDAHMTADMHVSYPPNIVNGNKGIMVKRIIHATGPMYGDGDKLTEKEKSDKNALLTAAFSTSLALAYDHDLESIAFPAISCGIYGGLPDDCATCALEAIQQVCNDKTTSMNIYFILYTSSFATHFKSVFGPKKGGSKSARRPRVTRKRK